MSDTPPKDTDDAPRSVDARTIHGGMQIQQAAPRPARASTAVQASDEQKEPEETPRYQADPEAKQTKSSGQSPGLTILQWLTYAFWGWTLLAVIWLVYIVVSHFISGTDAASVLPYIIATSLVLLPLSAVCDFFYSRKEDAKKSGVATLVMVVHAVIFALIGIGVLIGAVVVIVQLFVDGGFGSNDGRMTTLVTLLVSALLYGVTFIRTLNPFRKFKVGHYFSLFMTVVVGVFIVLAFVGPIAQSIETRDDRAIVQNMDMINQAVQDYVHTHKALPNTLDDTSLRGDEARRLVSEGLVVYRPGEVVASTEYGEDSRSAYSDHRYELCATYSSELDSRYGDNYNMYNREDDGYATSLYVSSHPAGEVCYKMKATVTGAARSIDVKALKL